MRMAGQGEADPLGHSGKQIRVVRNGQHWLPMRHLRQSLQDIVSSFHEIPNAGEPEPTRVGINSQCLVFQDGYRLRLKRVLNSGRIIPPIMIPKHGKHAKSCFELTETLGDGLGLDKLAAQYAVDDIVTGKEYEVGLGGIGQTHHVVEFGKSVKRRANV